MWALQNVLSAAEVFELPFKTTGTTVTLTDRVLKLSFLGPTPHLLSQAASALSLSKHILSSRVSHCIKRDFPDPGRRQCMSELWGLLGRTGGLMSSFEQWPSTLGCRLRDMSYSSSIFRHSFDTTSVLIWSNSPGVTLYVSWHGFQDPARSSDKPRKSIFNYMFGKTHKQFRLVWHWGKRSMWNFHQLNLLFGNFIHVDNAFGLPSLPSPLPPPPPICYLLLTDIILPPPIRSFPVFLSLFCLVI